jgi:hypothetical protein
MNYNIDVIVYLSDEYSFQEGWKRKTIKRLAAIREYFSASKAENI